MSGGAIPGIAAAATEGHVSAAAISANSRRSPPNWTTINSVLRFEPTWGDIDVLVRIIPLMGPNNSSQLLAALSAGHASGKAIQLIRNGAAHTNAQTLADIVALASGYSAFAIKHPTHAMFWTDPSSGDYLIIRAMDTLKTIGHLAIS